MKLIKAYDIIDDLIKEYNKIEDKRGLVESMFEKLMGVNVPIATEDAKKKRSTNMDGIRNMIIIVCKYL